MSVKLRSDVLRYLDFFETVHLETLAAIRNHDKVLILKALTKVTIVFESVHSRIGAALSGFHPSSRLKIETLL